jgi:hypothetical protein
MPSSSKPPIIGKVIEATTTVMKAIPKFSQIHQLASNARLLKDLIWPKTAPNRVNPALRYRKHIVALGAMICTNPDVY